MREILKIACTVLLCALSAAAQQGAGPTPARGASDQCCRAAGNTAAEGQPGLEAVLSQMDEGAAKFRSAEAGIRSDQYSKVVDETDTQSGKIYFQRRSGELQMAMEITSPDSKYVLLKGGKAQLYQPAIDQLTEYSLGANREQAEGMFALGFGGRGHDLLKSFDIKLAGSETIDGVSTSKLLLTPKTAKVLNMFSQIILWVDTSRDVSLQQEFDEPSGDWRRAHYIGIKLNQRIEDGVFKLKTTSNTRIVRPQG